MARKAAAPQISLFPPDSGVLLDDASGRIVYTPGFVADSVAETWFRELRDGVTWKSERRRMYDRSTSTCSSRASRSRSSRSAARGA